MQIIDRLLAVSSHLVSLVAPKVLATVRRRSRMASPYHPVRTVAILAILIGASMASSAQSVYPESIEFGTIPGNSNTGAHYSRGLSIRNNLDGEYLTLLSVGIRPPYQNGSGILEPTESIPAVLAPGDSIGFSYLLIVAAHTRYEYLDTVRIVVRRGERVRLDTLWVPVAATLTMSDEPFATYRDRGTLQFCRCVNTRLDGKPRTLVVGGLFLVNPGSEDLTLDSFRVTGTPGVVVNDSIRVFESVWSGSGPLPPSQFRRTPVRIVAGTTANVLFQFLAVPAGPKEARVTFHLRRPSGDTLSVTAVGSGSVIERNSVLAPLREFPLNGANVARVPVGLSDSTSLTLALYKCTVPGDTAVTIESVSFRRPNLLSLLSHRPTEPMRTLPWTITGCAGTDTERSDSSVIEYRLRYSPTEPGTDIDTAIVVYSYPTPLGVVRDSTMAIYFLEGLPSSAVVMEGVRQTRLIATPNPVNRTVWLSGASAPPGMPIVVNVYDAAGQTITTVPSMVESDKRMFVRLPHLSPGAYALVVSNGATVLGTARLIVAN